MMRIALAFVVVVAAACGGTGKPAENAGAGSGSGPALYAKKMSVGWGLEAGKDGQTTVYLQATDETGQQVSYPLGDYPGDCRRMTPAPEMKAITGVTCTTATEVVELDAMVQRDAVHGDEVVVLRGHHPVAAAGDPMAREEVKRVKAADGAKVEVAPVRRVRRTRCQLP